jgi:hypothetical protein
MERARRAHVAPVRPAAVPAEQRRPMCVIVVELAGAVRHYRVLSSPDVLTVRQTAERYTDLEATILAVRSFLQSVSPPDTSP